MESPENQSQISSVDHQAVIKHFSLINVIDTHYFCAKSSRHYLGSSLNIVKMYNLYVLFCKELGKVASKAYYYQKVFNNSFNLSFMFQERIIAINVICM